MEVRVFGHDAEIFLYGELPDGLIIRRLQPGIANMKTAWEQISQTRHQEW